jgi:sulfur carrier protein ThiS
LASGLLSLTIEGNDHEVSTQLVFADAAVGDVVSQGPEIMGGVYSIDEGAAMRNLDQERQLRELFDAHYTITELIERTGLSLNTIVKALNAPRVPKQRAADSQRAEPLGLDSCIAITKEGSYDYFFPSDHNHC